MSTPATQTVAVRTRGIDMFFGEGETKVTALKQADFEANRGELIMLVGPSGCGKTTLLSVIAGTLTPQTGTVEVFGQRLDGLSQEELTTFRRKHLGFVFQSFNLIPTLTVLENVMVPLLIQGAAQDVAVAKARAMLEKVGLKGREDGRPNALSGGQQQRVAIARALVHEPSLLICDEPTSALDKDTGAQIMQMVRDLSRSPDRCVVVVTHDHRIFRFADRIAEMEDGRIRRVVEDASLLDTNHL
ncbi:MAG: ABC transporter ATP-binding protein [Verrucomicrobiae bacterium]|jgi:putative ABC transport system ATP-binding protein|nr:ABC transporter ATP-binding protein [Verrucomicrobiae bacterium]PAZ02087.1 MAG: ABC transporter ATP-binding protein [Opitutae bacterium AMD-G3]